MAWCQSCDKYLTPSTLTSEGTCPACGKKVQHPGKLPAPTAERIPWHFWLLLSAATVYLAWRAVQGVALLL